MPLSSSAPQGHRHPTASPSGVCFLTTYHTLDSRAEDKAGESVLMSLGLYHRDTFLVGRFFGLWKRWAFRLLCPVRGPNMRGIKHLTSSWKVLNKLQSGHRGLESSSEGNQEQPAIERTRKLLASLMRFQHSMLFRTPSRRT